MMNPFPVALCTCGMYLLLSPVLNPPLVITIIVNTVKDPLDVRACISVQFS